MAISRIKKIEIIGLEKDRDNLLSCLQKLGLVELIRPDEAPSNLTPQTAEGGIKLIEIEDALSYLGSFQGEEAGFLKGIVKLKPLVYQEQAKDAIHNFDHIELLKELSKLRNHLKNILQCKERLIQERQLLLPWRALNIPLDQIHPTQACEIILGVLNTRDYQDMLEDFKRENINLVSEVVSSDAANTHLTIIYAKEEFEKLEAVLKNYRFNAVTLPRHSGRVKDRLLDINAENMLLDDQMEDIRYQIRGLSAQRLKLMVVYDYLLNMKKKEEAGRNLARQQYTFNFSGWIKERDVKLLEKSISGNFKDVALFISEPGPGEAPVDLQNNRLIQPFEFITKIYGLPKYNELDPTPFLAPFFFLYFGLCVSDVGYGLMIMLISWFILKKFRLGPQGLRFFKLFLLCGISTVIIGALTGSFFGNLPDILSQANPAFLPLKKFKDSLIILDPLKNPTKLLGIALSFGIVQIFFGNIVAAIGNIKNRRYLDILFDQATMLTFLFGLTGLGLIFLKLLGAGHQALFKNAAIAGAVALLLTQGRFEKGIGSKLFFGAYNLYTSLSGYLSDVLSYSRLWALGLVTGVMASTINLVSIQFSQILVSIIPFVNRIDFVRVLINGVLLAAIFVAGHIISFMMNLLGAFVHPLRLQFVEFFSKFFKSGGRAFKPFKAESRYVDIK